MIHCLLDVHIICVDVKVLILISRSAVEVVLTLDRSSVISNLPSLSNLNLSMRCLTHPLLFASASSFPFYQKTPKHGTSSISY